MGQHTGILELTNEDTGRLRLLDQTLVALPTDPVVPAQLIDKYQLRAGLEVEVQLQNGKSKQQNQPRGRKGQKKRKKKIKSDVIDPKAPWAASVTSIEGVEPQDYASNRRYEDLTTIDPAPRMTLEYPGCPPSCRLIDMFCPIGYGQRAMVVSPPKAGKTTLLKDIATAVQKNHEGVEVIALLIDERPEEVTDFRRTVPCQVLASSNDHSSVRHAKLSILAIERAKRLAESGKDVVVLLDSLTRVGRAFNTMPGMGGTGRTLSGGVDAGASRAQPGI